jgi:hypothetical protein
MLTKQVLYGLSHTQSISLWLFLEIGRGLTNYLPELASNWYPFDLSLLGSEDYRWKLLSPARLGSECFINS